MGTSELHPHFVIVRSCPMVKVCLLSNIYCTISCNIKWFLIMTFFNTIKCFHVAPFHVTPFLVITFHVFLFVTPFLIITFHVSLFLIAILTISKGHFKSLLGPCQLQGRLSSSSCIHWMVVLKNFWSFSSSSQ